MPADWQSWVCEQLGATQVESAIEIQSLWSGYGQILRLWLDGGDTATVILKRIAPPGQQHHPRGWNSSRSHQRKLRSYQVEDHWYRHWQSQCDEHCRVPQLLAAGQQQGEQWLLLEDMDAAGYARRAEEYLTDKQIAVCLRWLAYFHARFLQAEPEGLWPTGSYWHLETRPDELKAMDDAELQRAAAAIDTKLNNARYQTLIHGDAKVANFCFTADMRDVCAVDFQYVGGGCGMKDVIYFLGSCLGETQCDVGESAYLECYFEHFHQALKQYGSRVEANAVEAEWRELYPYAWTDFHRFLLGWMPGHWKINHYSHRLASDVIRAVNA